MFSKLSKTLPSSTKHICCIVIILALLALCCYCIRCLCKKEHTTTEPFNGGKSGNKTMFFFRADWCGHCTRFKPVWDDFKTESKKKFPDLELIELNVDDEASKPLMEKHNVRGFPHVVLTGDSMDDVVFNKNRTKEDLLAFIQEQL